MGYVGAVHSLRHCLILGAVPRPIRALLVVLARDTVRGVCVSRCLKDTEVVASDAAQGRLETRNTARSTTSFQKVAAAIGAGIALTCTTPTTALSPLRQGPDTTSTAFNTTPMGISSQQAFHFEKGCQNNDPDFLDLRSNATQARPTTRLNNYTHTNKNTFVTRAREED